MKKPILVLAALLGVACGGWWPPPNPIPTPTPTPPPTTTTTTTTTLPPPPEPQCAPGQACGCWHMPPGSPWIFACCADWVDGGVVNVSDPAACPKPPDPEPGPDPLPCGDVAWKQADDSTSCPVQAPQLQQIVAEAAKALPKAPTETEVPYYTRLCQDQLRPRGLDCAILSEELAVARSAEFSENYDLVLANGGQPQGAPYKSTCRPATRTQALACGSSSICPFTLQEFQTKGRWHTLNVTQGAGARKNADATPVVCDKAKCAELGFPPERPCCPAGVEGSENRAACDVAMTRPTWEIRTTTGGSFCGDGGKDGLTNPKNPLRNCMLGSGTIRVCDRDRVLCTEAVF